MLIKYQCNIKYQDKLQQGLIVNKKVNVKREYYKSARAMCHELFVKDKFYLNNNGHEKCEGTLNQLEGILSFINSVNYNENSIDEKSNNKRSGKIRLTRDFLFYKNFFALKKPLLICEGKTDNIYLKSALLSLNNDYNNLIEKKMIFMKIKSNFLI